MVRVQRGMRNNRRNEDYQRGARRDIRRPPIAKPNPRKFGNWSCKLHLVEFDCGTLTLDATTTPLSRIGFASSGYFQAEFYIALPGQALQLIGKESAPGLRYSPHPILVLGFRECCADEFLG